MASHGHSRQRFASGFQRQEQVDADAISGDAGSPAAPAREVAQLPEPRSNLDLRPDGRTAIYDIAAHAVHLPKGDRLEAHSGLGSTLDDPRYVGVKNRGPTPPVMACLHIPTCVAPPVSQVVVCPSAIILRFSMPF